MRQHPDLDTVHTWMMAEARRIKRRAIVTMTLACLAFAVLMLAITILIP